MGIQTSNHVMIFANGLPLKSGNEVVGAVSGDSGDQDQKIAEARCRGALRSERH
jgi:uncharacterized protein GlcG (DUF336 family)